jgi:uncharacterized protein (DUF1015 family)
MKMNFEKIGLHVPEILLPKNGSDMTKWSVVACDQYTSQPEYWKKAMDLVGDAPSTLNLIFPEVYLETPREEELVSEVNRNMEKYLDENILVKQKPGFVLVDRKTSKASSRKGLVVALDLEHYDFREGSETLIRATEGTIVDRLPPRIKVRKDAPIELPHIKVLIDDPDKTVIEPLFDMGLEKIYDFELMMESGHIKGYRVANENIINTIAEKLTKLSDPETFNQKHTVENQAVLLYAMGDGNHSFATAKSIWEELKKNAESTEKIMSHPARFALVELINLHDKGLEFEPIHRVVFNVDTKDLYEKMNAFYSAQGSELSIKIVESEQKTENTHIISFVTENETGTLIIKNPKLTLEVSTLQSFLDSYLENNKKAKIDYVHGKEVVSELGSKPGNVGFFLEPMSKHALFKTIILDGALPRKTFSMGEADEKRFYLECRKITA